MSAQEGFHHPALRSPHEASLHRIEYALATYGALSERRLLELLAGHGSSLSCRAALRAAVRSGAVRRVGDLYALPHR
ncbi:MAG TPA: hypothetical protein VFT50_07050 [Baekduia sp.]|nr:hypothetical protein [Baekduia sp.]